MTDRRLARASVHLTAIVAAYAVFAIKFWFLCDDSYITFRYSKNLASGYGVVFNRGEWPPVEGYSNFLWMLLVAALEGVGASIETLIPLMSAACGAVLLWRVWHTLTERLAISRLAATLATLTLSLSPSMGVWATSGLATMPFALLVWLWFETVVFGRQRDWAMAALVAMGVVLIRTEGVAWVVVVALVCAVGKWLDGEDLRTYAMRLLRIAAPVAVAVTMYQSWRYVTFGTLVPNTALVKVGFGPYLLARGGRYVVLFWLTTLTPLLSLAGAWWAVRGPQRGAWVCIALLAIGFPAYGVAVGGDFMPFGRMILPGLPFAAALLAAAFQHLLVQRPAQRQAVVALGAVAVLVGALPAFDLHVVPEGVRGLMHFRLSDKDFYSEWGKWDNMVGNTEGFITRGRALAVVSEPGDAVVSGAVGALGYYSNLLVLDQYGLVTKEVAYRPMQEGPLTQSPGHDKKVDADFFVKYAPKYLFARAVQGRLAAGRMKDTLEHWVVPETVMDRYVPDFVEVPVASVDERVFLLMVRRLRDGEDPAALWHGFTQRRRDLNAALRAEHDELEAELERSSDEG